MNRGLAISALFFLLASKAHAEDLYRRSSWSSMASDRKADGIGDLLTIVVYETAQTTNSVKTDSKRNTQIAGSIGAGKLSENGSLQIGGGYTGGGAVERSDRVVAQITVTVQSVLSNGDLRVAGEQNMRLNGESTLIGVEGRVRRDDILSDNRVISSRLADARITYNGRGFVAQSAKPSLVSRLFRFLGLG